MVPFEAELLDRQGRDGRFVEAGEHHQRDRQVDQRIDDAGKAGEQPFAGTAPHHSSANRLRLTSATREIRNRNPRIASRRTTERAAPSGQLKLWNEVPMRLAYMVPCSPPSRFGTRYSPNAGMKVMMQPATTPGMIKGSTTFQMRRKVPAPRFSAASSTALSSRSIAP